MAPFGDYGLVAVAQLCVAALFALAFAGGVVAMLYAFAAAIG